MGHSGTAEAGEEEREEEEEGEGDWAEGEVVVVVSAELEAGEDHLVSQTGVKYGCRVKKYFFAAVLLLKIDILHLTAMGLSNGGGGGGGGPSSYASDLNNFRKPSRLEALPVVDHRGGGGGGGGGPKAHGNGRRKGGGGGFGGGGGAGGPILNTMGTF